MLKSDKFSKIEEAFNCKILKTEALTNMVTLLSFNDSKIILKKVGEECTEVVIGAMKDSKEETIYEISDLAYHLLVLMAEMNITVDDIRAELASRHVVDKKIKQETMR